MQQLEDLAPALFDDSRKALEFALNADRVEMPRPVATRAMAAQPPPPPKKPRRKKKPKADELLLTEGGVMTAEQLLEAEHAAKTDRRSSRTPRPAPLRGLDAAHAAGFILMHVAELDAAHQAVLVGLCARKSDPCSCRAPCCSGERRNPRYVEAVKRACLILQSRGEVVREGKRGLSTNPAMRWALVDSFFSGRELLVVDAAQIGGVSTTTATRHRDWIYEYLGQVETEAWVAADALFDRVGITGSLE